MRAVLTAAFGFLVMAACAAHADTMFTYHGKALTKVTGNGIPGIKSLRFTLSGAMPAQGACVKNLTIVDVSDGAYSLKKLTSHGFTQAPGTKAEVCSDATTGALSEHLRLQLILVSKGTLQALYAWESFDPKEGKSADTVRLYANVEYHISASKVAGRLTSQ